MPSTMYQSLFSYNITRPYPFRWFTLSALIGGLIATILISLLNIAATGYELHTLSSSDPNATMVAPTWLGKWPSSLVSTHASCGPATIPLQTRLWTNNTGFSYVLSKVWKEGPQQILGSLVYNNQPLQNCYISEKISIEINTDGRTPPEMALIPVGATLTAGVTCVIDNPEGRTHFTLSGSYDPFNQEEFIGRSKSSKASLWWGESVIRL